MNATLPRPCPGSSKTQYISKLYLVALAGQKHCNACSSVWMVCPFYLVMDENDTSTLDLDVRQSVNTNIRVSIKEEDLPH